MALANNLTGVAATDGPMLEKLQGEISAAVQRNEGLQSLVCPSYITVEVTILIT
jgi:hypothetical protein